MKCRPAAPATLTGDGCWASARCNLRKAGITYLINNGKTIRVNYHDAPGTGNFLIVGDRHYQLTQFHFHRPSEEYLHGEPYEMVAHLMHEAQESCRRRRSFESGPGKRHRSTDLGTYADDRR
jgi:Eukaryotic-type carbonic anhydrase